MVEQIHMFFKLLKGSFRDLIPIMVVILFFQLFIIQSIPDNWQATVTGLMIVGIGLAIFLQGLEVGVFPIGEGLAREFTSHGSKFWVLLFGFMIGFGTTIAEPALVVIADKAAAISSGRINADHLRYVVALSVGFAILLGVFRIIKGHPIQYYIIAGYITVVSVTNFAPKEIIGLAYDLGGVTTSTVTVPLVAALGIGLASSIKGRNPVIDGFGLIAFASLTPMIFVQVYGIYVYTFIETTEVAQIIVEATASVSTTISFATVTAGLINVTKDVIPILAIILFFQYGVLKKPLPLKQLLPILYGFGLVIIGLYAFILGLEMGLFSLGESMAFGLTSTQSVYMIYAFGFAIGFSTTMAEPALMAIAKKAKEISGGKIDDLILRIFVAIGVAIGIALGSYRIVQGDHIHVYIMVGYLLVVILTFIAPKYIIPIAYDSGGVTTSTVTVPLVAALGIGLASNIDGRSTLIDGFGLIAFASLFPMLTVMLYGIITERLPVLFRGLPKNTPAQHTFENKTKHKIATPAGFHLLFSAVITIVPKEDKESALHAAREAGASGATTFDAQGMGMDEIVSFYRYIKEDTDTVLLFLVPSKLADDITNHIADKLHLNTTGSGIAFTFPITNLRGISHDQTQQFEKEYLEKTQKNTKRNNRNDL